MSYINRHSIGIAAFLLCVGSALAQNTNSGDIRGTAIDAAGAVIPSAAVTVLDVDKNTTKTYVTDSAGLYDTGPIVTDHYLLTFTRDGFKTYQRGPITLHAETLTINGNLEVGSATETVRVNTDVPLLQTESGAQTTTLSEQEMQALPNFASWEYFITLMPGSAGASTNGNSAVAPGQTASVNGNAVYYNVLGDGMTMSLPANGNAYDYNFDTLAEVQIATNGFSAQFENGGVIYNQISKGGSSKYHGDIFEYFQNNALNAAPYSFGQNTQVPVFHANYFGGSVGGFVPWRPLHNKLFFFFNFDYSQNYGGSSNNFYTVPTQAMLNGDFTGLTYSKDDGTIAPLLMYDPTTQTVDSQGALHRRTFADEYGNGNRIPASMIDPVAKAMQAYFPKPNTPGILVNGVPTNNYFINLPANSPGHALFWRTDYDITSKNRLTFTDFQSWGSSPNLGSGICPIGCNTASNSAVTAQVSDVWTLSANKINEFHYGFTMQNNLYIPGTVNQGYPAKMGWKFAKADIFPNLNIYGAVGGSMLNSGTNAIQHQMMFNPSDVFTLIKGKHVLHFGGEFLVEQINATNWGNIDSGDLSFDGSYTAATQGAGSTSGLGYADFLLGQEQSWGAANTPEYYPRYKSIQAFVQDDIKLRPNLTLNVGLRWEGWTSIGEKYGNEYAFDPTVVNPVVDPLGNANTLGAMWYATTHANGRKHDVAPIWDLFLPRVGAAWQVKSNTVLRGGFGLFAYNSQAGAFGMGSAFGQKGNQSDSTNGILPVVLLSSNGDTNYQGADGSSINSLYVNAPNTPQAYNGQSVQYVDYHSPAQKILQYNFEIQRELGHNMAANIAYVGSHGMNLAFPIDFDQIPKDKLGPNDQSGPTNARPYPNYQSIGGQHWVAISNYNALQATIQKRLSNGVQFNFNYTWSKFLNESESCAFNCATAYIQDGYDPGANYGPSSFDIRHMFKGRITYQLPFGYGQQFLSNNSILAEAIGGWQTAATIMVQTGSPFTPIMENNNSYANVTQYPNQVGNPKAGPHGTTDQWFNVNAFMQPTAGTFGDVRRNALYGPSLSNVNFSLGKNFHIWREGVFQIRADASNVFNHPSFGLPDNQIGPGHSAQITSVTVGGRQVEILGRLSF